MGNYWSWNFYLDVEIKSVVIVLYFVKILVNGWNILLDVILKERN